ncbi:MAG: TlpA family protein disulfide reductase [Mariniblastus sp.]
MRFKRLAISTLIVAIACITLPTAAQAQDPSGLWDAAIQCPGGTIEFGLELNKKNDKWSAFLINGPERIKVPTVEVDGQIVRLKIDHYDSELNLKIHPGKKAGFGVLAGNWKKRRGKDEVIEMKFSANRSWEKSHAKLTTELPQRWTVNFASDTDSAVGVFQSVDGTEQILGTFLTTTGDFRFLDGSFSDKTLKLSCFDGAHAFLFSAKLDSEGNLSGDFWSSNTWHDTWTAKPNAEAKLPDSFKQTVVTENAELGRLSFPDLDGNPTRLDDPKFAGKARIIYVFGTWCPNCHDAAEYFASLEKKYCDKGLSILGLAFEHTGDFKRDSEQVKKYLARHGSSYPVLVAGISDKAAASKALPILDRVRSYPTTIFLDAKGNIKAIHTGFTGPATGQSFEKLKARFESLILEEIESD